MKPFLSKEGAKLTLHLEVSYRSFNLSPLSYSVPAGGAVQVFGEAGQRVTLPCLYHYEDTSQLSQLSVQWRSPTNALLCHFIKHKSFTNCSDGYAISYQPANITLHVLHAHTRDYGTHVCSVSKPHQFSDYKVELSQTTGEPHR